MRVPWFNWRAAGRDEDVSRTACCVRRERTADEIALSLRMIPLYRVQLLSRAADAPLARWRSPDGRAMLAQLLGAERAERALRDITELGVAVIAVCPLELAEHYYDELTRLALPCAIQPA